METAGDWQFYFCRVDDQPASIFLCLDLETDPRLPHLGTIRVTMRQPRPDGLSSQDEAPELSRLEDALEAALLGADPSWRDAAPDPAARDFFFYLRSGDDWTDRVRTALADFQHYEVQIGTQHDPEWSAYHEFLSPNAEQRQGIENGKVCERLESLGDSLQQPREIDHWIEFPTAEARDSFERAVAGLGFQTPGVTHTAGDALPYSIQVFGLTRRLSTKLTISHCHCFVLLASKAATTAAGRPAW